MLGTPTASWSGGWGGRQDPHAERDLDSAEASVPCLPSPSMCFVGISPQAELLRASLILAPTPHFRGTCFGLAAGHLSRRPSPGRGLLVVPV